MREKIKKFWEKKWEKQEIPFHEEKVQSSLLKFESLYNGKKLSKKAFVPLCGKTKDMIWLKERGYDVFGIELSEVAIIDFMKENNLKYSSKKMEKGTLYSSEKINIYGGDIFDLPEELIQTHRSDFILDRAALIALDYEDRKKYYEVLKFFMKEKACLLLILFESLKEPPRRPPYPISKEELKENFSEGFTLELLEEKKETKERVYFVKKLN